MAKEFLEQVVGASPEEEIKGRFMNFTYGDLVMPSGTTVEVKRQPINPKKYQTNYVELLQYSDKKKHSDGWERLSAVVGLPVSQVQKDLDSSRNVAASLWTAVHAKAYIYCNEVDGYLYYVRSHDIRREAREAIMTSSLVQGAGAAHNESVGFKPPNPPIIFLRSGSEGEREWKFVGRGIRRDIVAKIKGDLL